MQGKGTTKTTFEQLFEAVSTKSFSDKLIDLGVDKYVKKLHTIKFLKMMIFAQMEQLPSLRDISNTLNDNNFSQALDLSSISHSQISRRLKSMPLEPIQLLFKTVIHKAGAKMGFNNIRQEFGRLYLIDSTVISLCLTQYHWAKFTNSKNGAKLHLRLRFFGQEMLPDEAIITQAGKNDRTQMDELVVEEEGTINVFDRGYEDYKKFDRYCDKNVIFVSRPRSNAVVEIISENQVAPNSKIISDRIVMLGTPGRNKMRNKLRRIETVDIEGNPLIIITNSFTHTAEEIADIYRYRWQIELFFKWIKQNLRVKRFYGFSQRAAEVQLYIALITYCLLMLLKLKAGYEGSLLTVKRLLGTCLYEPYTSFMQKLFRKPKRSSKERAQRINHEEVYQITLRQVIEGEADHLNDLTHDPLI